MKTKIIFLVLVLSATTAMACQSEVSKKECDNKDQIWNTNPELFLYRGLEVEDVEQCCKELDTNKTIETE